MACYENTSDHTLLARNLSCSNESLEDASDTISVNYFFAIFIPTLCFLICIGNLGTIVAFWKVPRLREKPGELLILSLSCADFITGFIIIPLASPLYIIPGYCLCMISIDRFLLVSKEYSRYLKIQTHLRIKRILLIGWSFSVLTGFVEVALWNIAKGLDESASVIDYKKICLSPPRRMKEFALTFFLSLYLSPVLLVCGMSIAFFFLLYKRLSRSWGMRADAQLPAQTSPSHQADHQQVMSIQQRKRYFKPAMTLLGLVTAMALCMLPYSLYVIAVEVFCSHCADKDVLYNLLLLQFCNACLDPLLYALAQKKIQNFYLSRLKKRSNMIKTV
ncbi:adenosine receptor A3-like [Amphiura filiformis]|uniref:adenosine receptor A3-like n=1 Tax=Amphiura filiformis TaxID=82378 RepID=UPI003B2131FE